MIVATAVLPSNAGTARFTYVADVILPTSVGPFNWPQPPLENDYRPLAAGGWITARATKSTIRVDLHDYATDNGQAVPVLLRAGERTLFKGCWTVRTPQTFRKIKPGTRITVYVSGHPVVALASCSGGTFGEAWISNAIPITERFV